MGTCHLALPLILHWWPVEELVVVTTWSRLGHHATAVTSSVSLLGRTSGGAGPLGDQPGGGALSNQSAWGLRGRGG